MELAGGPTLSLIPFGPCFYFDRLKINEALDSNMTIYQRYIHKYWDIILLAFIIALAALLRSGLLSVPLERDEGEYAYTAQLILQGIPPYAETYSMKMPGIYAVYAFFLMLFGQTHTGIHLGLLLVNILTIALLFLLARQTFDPLAAVVTCATFAILSLNDSLQGISANAEHFVVFAAVAGTLLLFRAITLERPKLLLWSGCFFGLGFLIKQHGLAFVAFACLYLLICDLKSRPILWRQRFYRWLLFLIGVVLPFGLTCLLLLILGVFDKFWFWTFAYARQYVTAVPFPVGVELLKLNLMPILASSAFIFLLAGIGLILLFFHWNSYLDKTFVLLFSLFSWLAVCPGLYFRPHYFVLTLPSVALLVGICLSSLDKLTAKKNTYSLRKVVPLLLLSFSLLHSVWYQRDYLFRFTPTMVARHVYGYEPFPESLEIAKYIKENSSEHDRIAVLGSEPQIYFYAKRRAATGYLYTYPLMEPQPYAREMQQEMIGEIESAHPEFLVLVHVRTSWLERPNSEKMIFTWSKSYRQKHYKLVGIIDILSTEKTVSRWGDECAGYVPRSRYWLAVFQRKGEGFSSELS